VSPPFVVLEVALATASTLLAELETIIQARQQGNDAQHVARSAYERAIADHRPIPQDRSPHQRTSSPPSPNAVRLVPSGTSSA
jgi:hypothetical protein